jgi:N-methylhydantoinase A
MKVAFDTGGTFTDFAFSDDDGSILLHKVLSTPDAPARAVLQGIDELLARVRKGKPARPDEGALQILGATTVVTNAVLERKGVDTAFITTDGFQDMLRIRTEGRYDLYDLRIQYPEPLVPRDRCFGVKERVSAHGEVITPLDEEGVKRIAATLVERGIRSVAVCLLHGYKYPAHEQRIGELLARHAPQVSVSLSSSVCPEVREYDRASTTVANAYTRPLMVQHVEHLEGELGRRGVKSQLLWMTSSGGVVPSSSAARTPVRLIESGPAAGAVAAAEYARTAGEPSVLSFDMGGTTAKLCLIPDGQPQIANELEVARHERFRKGSGFPLKIQSIHMIEIGAGGGSIAHPNNLGLLNVGPQSAESNPGPACYGLGGERPTVTDANVVLGYLDRDFLLGGDLRIDLPAAEAAIATVGEQLGLGLAETASRIIEIVNANMAQALRIVSIERGHDPQEFSLIAFGGAGPVHAASLAAELQIPEVIVPPAPGAFSALGLVASDLKRDYSRTLYADLASLDPARVGEAIGAMEQAGNEMLHAARVPPQRRALLRQADVRYRRQAYELTVPIAGGEITRATLDDLANAFHARHEQTYGHANRSERVQLVNLRVTALGRQPDLVLTQRADRSQARQRDREVWFPDTGFTSTPVHWRDGLLPGMRIAGPAIIEAMDSTTVVPPGWQALIDDLGYIRLTQA